MFGIYYGASHLEVYDLYYFMSVHSELLTMCKTLYVGLR